MLWKAFHTIFFLQNQQTMKKSVQVVPNLFWMIDSLETLQKSYFLSICIINWQCFATFSISITTMKKKREVQNLISANTMSSSLTVSTIGPVQSDGQRWSASISSMIQQVSMELFWTAVLAPVQSCFTEDHGAINLLSAVIKQNMRSEIH